MNEKFCIVILSKDIAGLGPFENQREEYKSQKLYFAMVELDFLVLTISNK